MSIHSLKPAIVTDYDLQFPEVQRRSLSNGMEVHILKGAQSGIIRLDLLWQAGRVTESKKGQSRSAVKCLADGYQGMNSYQLAEHFDYYGTSIGHRSGMESMRSSLSFLTKDIQALIPVFAKSLFEVQISQEEFTKRQHIFHQRLGNELEKNNVVAYREFTAQLFGETHRYGYNTLPEDYPALTVSDMYEFLRASVVTQGCHVILSGDVEDSHLDLICSELGKYSVETQQRLDVEFTQSVNTENQIQLPGKQPNQVSIRLGKLLFGRDHPDYSKVRFVNVLIGGYFGSRLMTNIREDKGYCYHIDSSVDCMEHGGYFSIGAEVNKETYALCLEEIQHEMNRLRDELVSDEELARLKQYLKGQILMGTDGVFTAAGMYRKFLQNNSDQREFYKQVEVINAISSEQIREICRTYLLFDDCLILTVGGRN